MNVILDAGLTDIKNILEHILAYRRWRIQLHASAAYVSMNVCCRMRFALSFRHGVLAACATQMRFEEEKLVRWSYSAALVCMTWNEELACMSC
jgi:hypothetical protein